MDKPVMWSQVSAGLFSLLLASLFFGVIWFSYDIGRSNGYDIGYETARNYFVPLWRDALDGESKATSAAIHCRLRLDDTTYSVTK